RPVAFTGKISYSLYLWHSPLIVFYDYAWAKDMDALAATATIGLTFGLSYLSWRVLEQPARRPGPFSRRQVFALPALGSALFIPLGAGIFMSKGVPDRFPPEIQKIAKASIGEKIPNIKNLGFEGNSGIIGDPDAPFSFVLWGDSHTRALTPAVNEEARK